MRGRIQFEAAIIPAARMRLALVACAMLLGGCSTFSPAPYYDPPYYIDDFGRVFYPEGREPWSPTGVAPAYGSVAPGMIRGPYSFVGPPPLIEQPLFGFHARGYFWPPVYRPPYHSRPVLPPNPGSPPPTMVAPPADPAMSVLPPAIPRPVVRYQPEPRDPYRGIGSTRPGHRQIGQPRPGTVRPDRPGNRRGAPRTTTPRPRPKPVPARPREIDPL